MIYALYYSSGEWEQYEEVILFSSEDKEFIETKRDEYEKLYDYLYERASKFYNSIDNRKYTISVETILNKYYKKLGIPAGGWGNYGFDIQEIRTYDEFSKKFGIK